MNITDNIDCETLKHMEWARCCIELVEVPPGENTELKAVPLCRLGQDHLYKTE
jgi:hypothetical protein